MTEVLCVLAGLLLGGLLGRHWGQWRRRDLELGVASEYLYRTMVEHLPGSLIYVLDQDLRIVHATGRELKELGIDPATLVGRHLLDFHPAENHAVITGRNRVAFRGMTHHFEAVWQDRTYNVVATPLRNAQGQVTHVLQLAQNITQELALQAQLAERLRHQGMLMAEIHHRVRNNLAVVVGLLQLQRQRAVHPEAIHLLDQASHRVQAMALIHQLVYAEDDFAQVSLDNYLLRLTEFVRRSVLPDEFQLTEDLELLPVKLDLVQAVPLALLLAELLNNSFRHGFQGRAAGILRIRLALTENLLAIEYQDDGPGWAGTQPISAGLGLNLVQGLAVQLGATLALNPPQAQVQLKVPLSVADDQLVAA